MTLKIRFLVLVVFLAFAPGLSLAAPLQAGGALSPHRGVQIAAEIGQQLQELVIGDASIEIEPQETFGTRALALLLNTFKLVRDEGTSFVKNFAAVPELKTWFDKQISNPSDSDRWEGIGRALLFVVGGAFLAGWLADFLFISFRRRLYQKEFKTASARLNGIFVWFLLSLIPPVIFVATALFIADHVEPGKLAGFIVMTIIYAMAILRLIRVGLRLFLSPKVPSLRLLPISTEQAVYAHKWIRTFSSVMVFGYFFSEIARTLKAPGESLAGFKSLLGLTIIMMTITIIMQKRSSVSTFLRGNLSAARASQSLVDSLRLWLARTWHLLAIAYLVVGYLITMIGAEDGFLLMQTGTIGTILSLFAMRFLFYMAAKISYQKRQNESSAGLYKHILRFLARCAIWILGIGGIALSWGLDVPAFLASPWGQRILGSSFSIVSTILILVFLYEVIHLFVQRKLNPHDEEGNVFEATARAKTLLPLIRYSAIVILSLIGGFVVLSELGVDTGPLLAGAGVLGVAIGFGSQTLVKDFLTGFFIILEESISIGDVVRVGDNNGVVESMTIRTVRLRDLNGNLHILPFSEISRIINSSKGFGQAVMDIGVAYDSDLHKVMALMEQVGEEMKADPVLGPLMMEPLDIMGVDELGDSAITVRGRIKTIPNQQWTVRRAFLLRIKAQFDKEGIEIPFPQRVIYIKQATEETETTIPKMSKRNKSGKDIVVSDAPDVLEEEAET